MSELLSRDELASRYLDQLPFEPYPVQEEALLAWFTDEQGVMVCTPTGTGKTLIAEAALFEALHTGRVAYYTTPLIALTDQKFREMQAAAVRWGFHPDDIGLVTGNRCINPEAPVRVVVAEILLNRLLHPENFDFADVAAVVMDEFHSFNDPERGIVWELSLSLLPKHVRLLLLSATVGNTAEFLIWLEQSHGRRLALVQSTDRKVPLSHEWVPDLLLNELLEQMADGTDVTKRTPALVFCFNREECWSVAEQLKGKSLLADGQQKQLAREIDKHDWSKGAGPKLKQVLLRGVGVHHAGMLPRYRRLVEELFQRKLLSVCVSTETLAAGINLPARSVVLTTLVKGPPGKKKLIDASSAHQMFGRAGRPQFDDRGYVYVLAHEDDVKISRWKEKYDQIPEDTKDPLLIKAKKRMKKKAPTRRKNEQYWTGEQFAKLTAAPPGKLASRGPLPWRLLAYLLQISPEVERLRAFAQKRLSEPKRLEAGQRALNAMLMSLWAGGFVTLEPEPPAAAAESAGPSRASRAEEAEPPSDGPNPVTATLGALLQEARAGSRAERPQSAGKPLSGNGTADDGPSEDQYQPVLARPTPALDQVLVFRSVNPLYGVFLTRYLGLADPDERIQALESVLELPGSIAPLVRVPRYDEMPPGPLARERLDIELVQRGVLTPDELYPNNDEIGPWEERRFAPRLAEKLRLLFDHEFPNVRDLNTRAVWSAGELLRQGGDFNRYVTSRNLTKQEGIIFRHLLRLILLCGEFTQLTPPEVAEDEWRGEMTDLAERLTATCRSVDPESTDKAIEAAQAVPDVVKGEGIEAGPQPDHVDEWLADFGEGID